MRIGLVLLLMVLLGGGRVIAEDEKPPARPLTFDEQVDRAAEQVLAAVEEADPARLKARAAELRLDPWLVANELCFRGKSDAALAYAEVLEGAATAKLAAYLERVREREPEREAARILRQWNAAVGDDTRRAAAEAAAAYEGPSDTVLGLRVLALSAERTFRGPAWREALPTLDRVTKTAREMGWFARAALLQQRIAGRAERDEDLAVQKAAETKRLAILTEAEDRAGIASALQSLGRIHEIMAQFEQAFDYLGRAAAIQAELGDARGAAITEQNIGVIHSRLGAYDVALEHYTRARESLEAAGDIGNLAIVTNSIGHTHGRLGDHRKALTWYERAYTVLEASGFPSPGLVRLGWRTLERQARAYERLGRLPRALSIFERILREAEAGKDRYWIARALDMVGGVQQDLGAFPEAFAAQERSLELMQALGSKSGVATAYTNLGTSYQRLAVWPKARTYYERALTLWEELGHLDGMATVLLNLGSVLQRLGASEQALETAERALALNVKLGRDRIAAACHASIGDIHAERGAYEKALEHKQRALEMQRAIGNRIGIASALGQVGLAKWRVGDKDAAETLLSQAVREARRLRAWEPLLDHLSVLGHLRLEQGQPGRALMAAQEGLTTIETVFGGLAEDESAASRSRHLSMYRLGVRAAAALEEPAEVLRFLESGRAGALLETLGGRQALAWADLPEPLREAEAAAKAAASRARWAYNRALGTGKRRAIRAAARALDAAMEDVREVASRIQREAKRAAGLVYPRAATLEELQGWLESDQAMVLYALDDEGGLALVLTADAERIVDLGERSALDEVVKQAASFTRPGTDADAARAALVRALVTPLGLGEEIRHVLLSPDGALCYVPFGALFDVPVAVAVSGTTHALLMEEERERGEGVLALGDPDYGGVSDGARAVYVRGGRLAPLPATRVEVKAVGTDVLLGAEATEDALRKALAKRTRWRAVHLACHGLVDPDRPTLSSLALSSSAQDDGFLTALEVLRMRVPADLAVLSACETATGRLERGEGIVGLTRAFMYAGAPRVLCSLWKVDDAATQALMTRFYELWGSGEGLSAAEALRQAQGFVREQAKWAHPYYWAAWSVWGLP
ncbi:MAG: CHAT domain-containing protein [Planctomycetota bacterium]|nr:CHAT domain-containing protein [Planctomycetota bacterium]